MAGVPRGVVVALVLALVGASLFTGMKNAVTKLVPGPQTRRERRAEARRASRTASFVNEKVAKRTVWSGLCCVAGWCISWTPAPKFYAYCTSKRAASQEPQPGMTDNSPAPSGPKAAAPGPQPEAPNTSSPAAKPKTSGIIKYLKSAYSACKKTGAATLLRLKSIAAPKATTSQEGAAAGADSAGKPVKGKPTIMSKAWWKSFLAKPSPATNASREAEAQGAKCQANTAAKKTRYLPKWKRTPKGKPTAQESEAHGTNDNASAAKPGCLATMLTKIKSVNFSFIVFKKTVGAPSDKATESAAAAAAPKGTSSAAASKPKTGFLSAFFNQGGSNAPEETKKTEGAAKTSKTGMFSFLGSRKGSQETKKAEAEVPKPKSDSANSEDRKTLGERIETFLSGLNPFGKKKINDNETITSQSQSASPRTSGAGSNIDYNGKPYLEALIGSRTSTSGRSSSAGGAPDAASGDASGDASGASSSDACPDTGRRSSPGNSSSGGSTTERSLLDKGLQQVEKRMGEALLKTKQATQGAMEDVSGAFDKLSAGTSNMAKSVSKGCKGAARSLKKSMNKFGAAVVVEVTSIKVPFAFKSSVVNTNQVNILVTSE